MLQNKTDEELMALYQQSNQAVFSELFTRYSASIANLMRRQIRSSEDIKELVQQTFLQLHKARFDYNPSLPFKPWLITIALNLRRQFMRKKGRSKETPLTPDILADSSSDRRDIEQLIEAQRLRFALHKLKVKERMVVEMFWFEGLSFHHIAQAMRMSLSAAKVTAHRAYKKLRQLILAEENR